MSRIEGVLQVNSVKPGSFGGAVFSGRIVGQPRIHVCKASYKIVTRAPQPGECWKIKGFITKHDEYRNFVQVEKCHIVALPEAPYVERLLQKHPAFRGFYFGKEKIKDLLREFGAENLVQTLNAGKTSHIAEVIQPALADKVVEAWLSLQNEIATMQFLIEYRFDPDLTKKIIKVCRIDTVERLKQNPYGLVAFKGLHRKLWETIEATARKLSIPKTDPRRLAGAVEHALYDRLSDGHTACPLEDLIQYTAYILEGKELAEAAVKHALERKVACSIKINGQTYIQPLGAAIIEGQLERRIKRLLSGQQSLFTGGENKIETTVQVYSQQHQKEHGHGLNEQQQGAVSMALANRISIITGFGGTGKTTVLRAVVELAAQQHRPVWLLALSGKAKERARDATGIDTYTIHSFIRGVYDQNSPISANGDPLVIIDEASMVDVSLMNRLLKLFDKKNHSLLMVGDTGQLSPVGFGLFWHKLARSETISVAHLTQVYRTSEDGDLHRVAMQIRDGKLEQLPIWEGQEEGVYLVPCEPNSKSLCSKLVELKKILPDTQIITPHMSHHMADSGNTINNHLQVSLAGTLEVPGIQMGHYWLKVGDPVIVTQNSYQHNLFNGNTGEMVDLVEEDGELFGVFFINNLTYTLARSDLWLLGMKLAHAISIHKSQGSEYNASIICSVVKSNFIERSMLYTALTRSQKLSLIVGSQEVAEQAVSRPNRSDTLCVGFRI